MTGVFLLASVKFLRLSSVSMLMGFVSGASERIAKMSVEDLLAMLKL
jgi:hypothetical protein